jgi:IMP dehydrogenase
MQVGGLATDAVNCLYAGTPLDVAERELSLASVPYGVVIDDDRSVAGILTDSDLIEVAEVVEGEDDTGESIANEDDEWMWEGIKAVGNRHVPTRNVIFPEGTVREYMSGELVTVSRTKTAREAARQLLSNDIEQVPLMSGGQLVGIVRDMDLLKAL